MRRALGASSGDIVWLVLRETVLWLAIGIAAGAAVSAIAGRFVASQLFGVTPRDPALFPVAAAVLIGIALVASLIPAARAIRIHPTVALRTD